MLKTRIMPTLLFKDLGLVKGIAFDSWRRVGSAMQAVKVYDLRQVDEMVFLAISATRSHRPPDFETIDELAGECFVPLTAGGGVRHLDDVRQLLRAGADKVAVNTAAVESPQLIRRICERFGSQCLVVSIDAKKGPGDSWEVLTHSGTVATGKDPVAFAAQAQQLAAGEILLTSVDRDGTMTGYDIELTRRVSAAVSIPVIASGGVGSYEHLAAVLEHGGAAAVAASSIFHFTQQSPLEAKRFLHDRGIAVRL